MTRTRYALYATQSLVMRDAVLLTHLPLTGAEDVRGGAGDELADRLAAALPDHPHVEVVSAMLVRSRDPRRTYDLLVRLCPRGGRRTYPVAALLAADAVGLATAGSDLVQARGPDSYTAYTAAGEPAYTRGGDWTAALPAAVRAAVRDYCRCERELGYADRVYARAAATPDNRAQIAAGGLPHFTPTTLAVVLAGDPSWGRPGREAAMSAARAAVRAWLDAAYPGLVRGENRY